MDKKDSKKRFPDWIFWIIICFCFIFLAGTAFYIAQQGKSCIEDPFSYSANKISKAIGDIPVLCSCQAPSLEKPYLFSSGNSSE